jgi:hypothetical protein
MISKIGFHHFILPQRIPHLHSHLARVQPADFRCVFVQLFQDNSQKVKDVMAAYVSYFDGVLIKDFEINR